MLGLPKEVVIEDEFLRDGLQIEQRLFSVQEKLEFAAAIEQCGVGRIQLGSFVHPKRIPQMANTDEVFDTLDRTPGVTYTALVLNMAGLDRALKVGVKHLSISLSASETHSRANLNKSVSEARSKIRPVVERALAEGVTVRAGIQSALGCGFEGRIDPAIVFDLACGFAEMGVHEVNISDTAGLANPAQVFEICRRLMDELPDVEFSLHLHDTRGLGIANMLAGLQAGIRVFDAALGGLGGCPFIPKASGNIATEDAAFLCEQIGVATGIDWAALAAPVKRAEEMLGRSLPGKVSQVPLPPRWTSNGAAA
ncbi:MAG: hydroxymethylglutaryl-CoA lyase [Pseudomonadota bacterium]